MLTTTVIDPALVREVADRHADTAENEMWFALLRQLLRAIQHGHVLLRSPGIATATREALKHLQGVDSAWYQRFEALMGDSRRLVDQPAEPIAVVTNETIPADAPSTESALALAKEHFVDMLCTNDDGEEHARDRQLNLQKILTPGTYPKSELADNDASRWGGVLLAGKPDDLLGRWFEPFLRWAEVVQLIDPYIGTACVETGFPPSTRKGPNNWAQFQTTITRIHSAWREKACCARKQFEVVTVSAPADVTKRDYDKWNDLCRTKLAKGKPEGASPGWCEARYIHEQLAHGSAMGPTLKVTLIDDDDPAYRRSRNTHDRWLINRTHGNALNLSRGFDLFSGSTTRQCMICFMGKLPDGDDWSLAGITPWASYGAKYE